VKREDLFGEVGTAADRFARGQKHEAPDSERRSIEIAAAGEIMHDIIDPRGFQPGERHMRRELAGVRLKTDALADPLDLALQGEHVRRLREPGPDRVRLFGAEGTDALQPELEFRSIYPVQPVDDLIGRAAIDIADEAQGDVIIFNVDPPGSRETTAQQ